MERTILPDGTRIETLAWGDGEPRACLLHEGLGSARLWRGFGAALAARLEPLFRCLGKTIVHVGEAGAGQFERERCEVSFENLRHRPLGQ